MQRVGTGSEPRRLYCSINFCDAVYTFFLALVYCNSRVVTNILVKDKGGSIIFMDVNQNLVVSQGSPDSYEGFRKLLLEIKQNGVDVHTFGSTEDVQRYVRNNLNPEHKDLLFDHVHLSNKVH